MSVITRIFLLAFAAAFTHASAAPADGHQEREIEARYQRERAVCESGRSQQNRETCLREAAAARDAARRGQLADAPNNYEQNALARCEALPPKERDLCRRRTRGEGETRGSVNEGGIYREYREITLPELQAPQQTTPDKK